MKEHNCLCMCGSVHARLLGGKTVTGEQRKATEQQKISPLMQHKWVLSWGVKVKSPSLTPRDNNKGPNVAGELAGAHVSPSTVAREKPQADVTATRATPSGVKLCLFAGDRHRGQRRPSCGVQVRRLLLLLCVWKREKARRCWDAVHPPLHQNKKKKKYQAQRLIYTLGIYCQFTLPLSFQSAPSGVVFIIGLY